MKSYLVTALKGAVSIAIVAYLVNRASLEDPDTFARVLAEPKRWELMFSGWACFIFAQLSGLLRWLVLLRAGGISAAPSDVLRTGVLAYMVDFMGLGAAGGDVFKVVFLSRRLRAATAAAFASVIADRLIGLLCTVTVVVAVFTPLVVSGELPSRMWPIVAGIGGVAVVGLVAVLFVLVSRRTGDWLRPLFGKLPVLGSHAVRLYDALAIYLSLPQAVASAAALSLVVLAFNITGFACLAGGLSDGAPGWVAHSRIVPLSLLSGVVPLPADALGALDYAMGFFYRELGGPAASASLALMVVMSFRVVGVVVTGLGILVYAGQRGEVGEALASDETA